MKNSTRRSELALILCFAAVIACVPLTQTCLEVFHGQRAQLTDLLRYKPTAANLRRFERTLEGESWFQQNLRPPMQSWLFRLLRDTGAKGLLGRDQWLFFRPDVRYLLEPDRLEPSATVTDAHGLAWLLPSDRVTRRESVLRAILSFRDELKSRGIELLVMPVPGKPSIYPDKVTSRMEGRAAELRSPTLELLAEMNRQGVATVDLFAAFRQARADAPTGNNANALYLAQDTHWTPRGAQLAAETVAQRLRDLGWTPPASRRYQTFAAPVKRYGDVLEMTQIRGLRQHFGGEQVECQQVRSSTGKLLIPSQAERGGVYKPPGAEASILVLGDSFCRIYQLPEPLTLGELPNAGQQSAHATSTLGEPSGSKCLLPGSAGFLSLLMHELQAPVDYIVSDGGAASDVRKKLATNPAMLEDKRVVLWEFVERDIALGGEGWEDVPLPPNSDPR
jgi:hypothetical protein